MQAEFICHRDFTEREPRDVFHKEHAEKAAEKDEEKYCDRHILFRKKLTLAGFSKAILKITADDCFKLYINGKFVSQGPHAGYPQKYYYSEPDVTDFLVRGENVIAVHTYYQGLVNRVWVSGDGRACLWCELVVDGVTATVSDESWLCRDHGGYSACGITGYDTCFLERYDSGSAEEGFERVDFDDSGWERASVFRHADYVLEKSPVPPVVTESYKPAVWREDAGRIFLDFGQEMAGGLRLSAEGKRGDRIVLRFGEELSEGRVRFDMRCNCRYEEEWILSGGRNSLEQFGYKAFRYAELLFPQGVRINGAEMLVRHYPFRAKAEYRVPEGRLRDILRLCENTVRYGVQEIFPDCLTREKGQYLGDLCVSGRAHAVLTGDASLLKKAIDVFCVSAFVCNGLLAVAPCSHMQEIADYSLMLPALVLWVYRFDGDLDFVKRVMPCLRKERDYFRKFCNADGLLDGVNEKWNLVDWPEKFRDGYNFPLSNPVGRGAHNVLNAFWIGFLQALNELCRLAGLPEAGDAAEAMRSFFRYFYSEETGLFCDSTEKAHSSVHSNVLPLLFGIGTEDEALRERLIRFICSKGLTSASVYFSYFTLAALVKNGERQKALELASEDGAWANMLREGATTTFEAWGKEDKWNTSLFHLWGVAPLIVFCEGVAPY